MCVCVCVSQNELRPAYEDFLLKKQEKAKKKKKEEVNCTLMYKTIRLYALTNEFIIEWTFSVVCDNWIIILK